MLSLPKSYAMQFSVICICYSLTENLLLEKLMAVCQMTSISIQGVEDERKTELLCDTQSIKACNPIQFLKAYLSPKTESNQTWIYMYFIRKWCKTHKTLTLAMCNTLSAFFTHSEIGIKTNLLSFIECR